MSDWGWVRIEIGRVFGWVDVVRVGFDVGDCEVVVDLVDELV